MCDFVCMSVLSGDILNSITVSAVQGSQLVVIIQKDFECVCACVCGGADVWSVTHDSRLILFHESVPKIRQSTVNVKYISVNHKMFVMFACIF